MSFPTCKFFRSGSGCKFGNKCRYRHSDQSSSFPTALNCRSENGEPLRGISYRRQCPELPFEGNISHSEEDEDPVRSSQTATANTFPLYSGQRQLNKNEGSIKHTEIPLSPDTSEYIKEAKKENESVTVKHSQANPQRPSRKICHYFARNGTCCFGSQCRFVHVSRYAAAPRFRQAETQGEGLDIQSGEQGHQQWEQDKVSQSLDTHQKYLSSSSVHVKPARPEVTQNETRVLASDDDQSTRTTCRGEEMTRAPNRRSHFSRPDRICQYYLQGRCYKGARKCRFLHPRQKNACLVVDTPVATESEKDPNTDEPGKYVTAHQDDELNTQAADGKEITGNTTSKKDGAKKNEDVQKSNQSAASHQRQPRTPYVAQGIKKYRRDEIDDVEGSRLRRNEIDQLIKRFPKNRVKVNRDCAEYFQCIIDFTPTDPDWPFDVKLFQLQVDIPSDYPLEMLSVSLPLEQNLPETVRRYLEVSIEEWLEEKECELRDKGQVELVFRSFLRWLDRNVEDIVTEGLRQLKRELVAKASGLEFISAKQLQKQYPVNKDKEEKRESDEDEAVDSEEEDEEETSGTDEEDSSSDYDDESGEEEESADVGRKESSVDTKNTRKTRLEKVKDMLVEPDRRGTEVSLKNLQLRENAAMMYFDKVCLVIQCERCKGPSEFTTSGGRVNVVQCGQCSQTQMCTFRPAMVHQFSPVLGYLDLDACLPFDIILQNCSMVVSCLHCSKETRPGALVPGTFLEHWCRACHQKLRISTDGVRFTQLEPSSTLQSLRGAVKVVVPTRKKIPKDPAIQEGKPLPNFGTCKHYKKSYRWLRFPCCGKVYPCDLCHDSKEDHEMKLANRMICGFCCKEQVYSVDRPCKGCDMNMTRIHTKHWEGGVGCRDKISMSRNDKAKHKNMSKTVSKHSQKVKDMQSKKRTKLRHA